MSEETIINIIKKKLEDVKRIRAYFKKQGDLSMNDFYFGAEVILDGILDKIEDLQKLEDEAFAALEQSGTTLTSI